MYNLQEILTCLPSPPKGEAHRAMVLGLAARMLQPRFGGTYVAQQLDRMFVQVDACQYEFYFDQSGRPAGFVAWVLVGAETSRTLILHGSDNVAPSQWQAGKHLWILDLVAHDGCLPYLLAQLRDVHLVGYDEVKYVRFKRNLRIAKQLGRQDKTSFFRRPAPAAARLPLTQREDFLLGCAARLVKARLLGEVLLAMRACDAGRKSSLWRSTFVLSEIIALRQYRSYSLPQQAAAGLLTWAWLSPHTIARIADHPLHTVHSSEWNEGDQLCLYGAVASKPVRAQMEADICGQLFPLESKVLLYIPPTDTAPARLVQANRQSQADLLRLWLSDASAV